MVEVLSENNPDPPSETVILVTTPAVTDAVAAAFDPVPPILTNGIDVYPEPPSEMTMEVIDPPAETTAVAAAPVTSSFPIRTIVFWKVKRRIIFISTIKEWSNMINIKNSFSYSNSSDKGCCWFNNWFI